MNYNKKKCLLIQVQIHRYCRKLPLPWPQRNTAGFYWLSSASTKALSHHPAQPCTPAGHLFRATYRYSLYTDDWRDYCCFSAWKWAHTLSAAAPSSTERRVPNLTFPCPWCESRPCCKNKVGRESLSIALFALLGDCHYADIYHRRNCNWTLRLNEWEEKCKTR